jgi:outer membrane protein OmpA-like peptidoglycan-associated protein/Mg-chelatase subunit ChlD
VRLKSHLIFLIIILITACATYDPLEEKYIPDQNPPSDYDPLFIQNIQTNSDDGDVYKAVVSRIVTRDPNKLKFHIHVVDSNYDYLSGLTPDQFKDIWCGFRRNTNFNIYQDDFNVYEVNENDVNSHAVALVMDHSGSMGEVRAKAVQNAAGDFIDLKKADDEVSLIKYDYRIVSESPLSDSKQELLSRLQKNGLTGFGGTTASADAVHKAIDELKNVSDEKNKIVIVFTDGYDNNSKIPLDSVISYAVQNDVTVCGIDFGYNISPDFLEKLTKETGGIYHHIYGTHEFDYVFEDIYNKLYNYYVLEIDQPDFGEHIIEIDLCPPGEKITFDAFFNNMPHIGEVTLLNVYFDTNSDKIKPESQKAIDRVGALLQLNPTMKIELRGHTDSKGNDEHNMDLSQRRAKSVKEALIKYGITGTRITYQGYGETMPIADNETEKGRAKNRRTEFIINEK